MNATALTAGAAPEIREAGPAAQRRAIVALARIEAVRLLRHPITIAAALFLAGLWVSGWFTNQANQFPVLQDVDRDTAFGVMVLLGGAALIAGNLAVLRAHRNGTTGLGDVLVLPYPLRTAAHLLALLPLAVLAAALTLARIAVLDIAPAAGHPNPYELATGPVTVLLLGALGVLLGRLTRSAIAAPLALLAVLATLIVIPLLSGGGTARWLQPVVPQGEAVLPLPAPAYLMARPAGPHLAYLLGLTGLLAAAALLRSGTRAVRVAVAGMVALTLAIAGGIAQTAPPSRAVTAARTAAMYHPAAHETCRQLGHVTYCAFGDFTRWIPAWNAVVQEVLARVPATGAWQPLTIRQRITVADSNGNSSGADINAPLAAWQADDRSAGTPGAVTVGTRWGDSRSTANLAALVAYRLVTARGSRIAGGHGIVGAGPVCGAAGVLVVWLAGQASPASDSGLRHLIADQDTNQEAGVDFAPDEAIPVSVPQPELTVALEALGRPAGEIAARVLRSWDVLTAPRTTTQQAAHILGVPAPAPSAGQPTPAGRRGAC